MYIIEFQERGLPHTHILLWLDTDNKLITKKGFFFTNTKKKDINKVNFVEIPHPDLWSKISVLATYMI